MATDIRDLIFASICSQQYTARLVVEREGVISGISRLEQSLREQNIKYQLLKHDGEAVRAGEVIVTITGTPKQIAMAEEFVIGMLSKPSGIATAAATAVALAGRVRIVSGAWKKMPPELKVIVRQAVRDGGAYFRISDQPFLYLDKNFVRMLGGIKATLQAVKDCPEIKAIQLKGEDGSLAEEALTAATYGAGVIMVDTGNVCDIRQVSQTLKAAGLRDKVELAFAKGIDFVDISNLVKEDIDSLDIGMRIIDAPLLDMKLDVIRG